MVKKLKMSKRFLVREIQNNVTDLAVLATADRPYRYMLTHWYVLLTPRKLDSYVCMYVGTYVRTYVRMYVRTYVCMYVCLSVCMYVCVDVCMCVCVSVM